MNYFNSFISKSGKEITFRYPTIDDAKKLKNYINQISREKTFITYQGEQQTLESETKWLQDNLDKISNNKCVFLCAFFKDKLIGSSVITLQDKIKSHVGTFGITIHSDYRREGIGNKLMELVIELSIKKIKNLRIIELEVYNINLIAKKLYEKHGFVKYGLLPSGIEYRGKFVDAVLMYKKVN